MTLLHRLCIIVDYVGQPQAATIEIGYDTPRSQVEVIPVGPFDTLSEVMDRVAGRVDTQLRLW